MADNAQENAGVGACIAYCCLACLKSILEYFNKWGFVYVGIYGKTFVESSKAVIALFKQRGFEGIISDDLTSRALSFCCFGIGKIFDSHDTVVGMIKSAKMNDFLK